jgi:hypothetical protein
MGWYYPIRTQRWSTGGYVGYGLHRKYPGVIITVMATDHILSLLIEERTKIDQAIAALRGTPRRGGRPRKNLPSTLETEPVPNSTVRKRPRWTPAMRRAASIRAKAAYAKRQAGAGKKR